MHIVFIEGISLPECGFFSVTRVPTTTSYLSLSHNLSFVLGLSGWEWFSCVWWGSFGRWTRFLHPRLAHFCKFHSSDYYFVVVLQAAPQMGLISLVFSADVRAPCLCTGNAHAQNHIFFNHISLLAVTWKQKNSCYTVMQWRALHIDNLCSEYISLYQGHRKS